MLPILVPLGILGLAGLAYWKSTEKKRGMTPERELVLNTALSVPVDSTKLRELAAAFKQEGLAPQGELLEKRAALRELPPETKEARKEVFQTAMGSKNPDAIKEVAKAFEREGATGAAATLNQYAAGLARAAPTITQASMPFIPPVAQPAAVAASDLARTAASAFLSPASSPTFVTPPFIPPMAEQAPQYTVKKGDYPWKLATEMTGKGSRWPELVRANPHKAKAKDGNFKSLLPGEKLNLPPGWTPKGSSPLPFTFRGEDPPRLPHVALYEGLRGNAPLSPQVAQSVADIYQSMPNPNDWKLYFSSAEFGKELRSIAAKTMKAVGKDQITAAHASGALTEAVTERIAASVLTPDEKRIVQSTLEVPLYMLGETIVSAQNLGIPPSKIAKIIGTALQKISVAIAHPSPKVQQMIQSLDALPSDVDALKAAIINDIVRETNAAADLGNDNPENE